MMVNMTPHEKSLPPPSQESAMDKPIPEAVARLLKEARQPVNTEYGCFSPSVAAFADKIEAALTAAQRAEVDEWKAVACVACEDKPAPGNNPCGWCGRTAPPNVPVGVERLVSQWRSGCISAQEAMISISQQAADFATKYRTCETELPTLARIVSSGTIRGTSSLCDD